MAQSLFFVINAPPFALTKANIYSATNNDSEEGTFIKSISDAFFLSNNFRKSLFLYYCTFYLSKPYIITFDGNKLRYLGPSSFSATHLLLRATNHIFSQESKVGKLTPGLNVIEGNYQLILEKHAKDKCTKIIKNESTSKDYEKKIQKSNVFLFGFDNINLPKNYEIISLGPLDIDEQVILTNYNLERKEA